MRSLDLYTYLIAVLVAGLGLVLIIGLLRVYWHGKLREWAAAQGFKLISFRPARSKEGPRTWRRRNSERLFRIAVEDDMRSRRAGWVMYGGAWGTKLPQQVAKVLWDDWDD